MPGTFKTDNLGCPISLNNLIRFFLFNPGHYFRICVSHDALPNMLGS